MTDGMRITLTEGNDDLEVAGESFYQDNLWSLVGGRTGGRVRKDTYVLLVAEHDNRYDANAISIWASGLKVGHLSREDAALLRPGLLALQQRHGQAIALEGAIVGGGADEGRAGTLGVFLDFDAGEFGITRERSPTYTKATGAIRSGLSRAVATDDDDDSHDLGWRSSLSDNPAKRIAQLRRLLQGEKS